MPSQMGHFLTFYDVVKDDDIVKSATKHENAIFMVIIIEPSRLIA